MEEKIDEQTKEAILKLMELFGCETPKGALNMAIARAEELVERVTALEEEREDHGMTRELLRTRQCIFMRDH